MFQENNETTKEKDNRNGGPFPGFVLNKSCRFLKTFQYRLFDQVSCFLKTLQNRSILNIFIDNQPAIIYPLLGMFQIETHANC
jgi:hypothetical protein